MVAHNAINQVRCDTCMLFAKTKPGLQRASGCHEDALAHAASPPAPPAPPAPRRLQALLGTALRLPPRYFRRLLQSNGATSVLDFEPPQGPGAPVRVTVDRLNQVGRRGDTQWA